jgi:arsenate reductase
VDPRAVIVMAEAGVDISQHRSKHVYEVMDLGFDVVITVCSHAHETCPVFPRRARIIHHGFDDPPYLARGAATEEEALSHYRRVRDDIRSFVEDLPEMLGDPSGHSAHGAGY